MRHANIIIRGDIKKIENKTFLHRQDALSYQMFTNQPCLHVMFLRPCWRFFVCLFKFGNFMTFLDDEWLILEHVFFNLIYCFVYFFLFLDFFYIRYVLIRSFLFKRSVFLNVWFLGRFLCSFVSLSISYSHVCHYLKLGDPL